MAGIGLYSLTSYHSLVSPLFIVMTSSRLHHFSSFQFSGPYFLMLILDIEFPPILHQDDQRTHCLFLRQRPNKSSQRHIYSHSQSHSDIEQFHPQLHSNAHVIIFSIIETKRRLADTLQNTPTVCNLHVILILRLILTLTLLPLVS